MLARPLIIVAVLEPFAVLFTRPTWAHPQVLVIGTLARSGGARTVTAALAACDGTLGRAELRALSLPRVLVRIERGKILAAHSLPIVVAIYMLGRRPWILIDNERYALHPLSVSRLRFPQPISGGLLTSRALNPAVRLPGRIAHLWFIGFKDNWRVVKRSCQGIFILTTYFGD